MIVDLRRHRLAEAAAAVRHRAGRPSEGGRRHGGARPARRRRATCRTISTSTSSANAPATTPTTTIAKPHRTAWAGLQYLLFKQGAGGLDPVRDRRLLVRRPGRRARPTSSSISGSGSGIEAGVAKLKNAGVTLNSAFLRPRSRGTVRLASGRSRRPPADRPELLGRPLRPRHVARGPAAWRARSCGSRR